MSWMIWVIAGLLLLGSEMLIPLDFYLVFIGLAAIFNGLLVALGFLPEPWMQWSSAAVLSVLFVLGIREKAVAKLLSNDEVIASEPEGDDVKILSEIEPGENGKGEYRGSSWRVKNESASTLQANKSYVIAEKNGITLIVR